MEFCRRVYFGNMPHALRRYAWPFLLGFYPWTADDAAIDAIYRELHNKYEGLMTEWTAAEAIVKERDKEAFKAGKWESTLALLESEVYLDASFQLEKRPTCLQHQTRVARAAIQSPMPYNLPWTTRSPRLPWNH